MISGMTFICNGIECGYIFSETMKTLEAMCDEVIICEGFSDDDTYAEILKHKSAKTKIFRDEWHKGSGGAEFRRITELGVSRCNGDYTMMLQADEVIHETMSIRELQRALAMISEKRKRLKVVGAEVGSDRVVTARSLLTGV